MELMTSSDAAVAIGRSASTIRGWTEQPEMQKFLSDSAKRTGDFAAAKERRYNLNDLYVLNTVRSLDPNKNSWEEIGFRLDNGYRDEDLPASAALVLPETKLESFQLLTIARQNITMLQEDVTTLQREKQAIEEYYRGKLDEKEKQHREDIERLASQANTDSQTEIKSLIKTIARLELLLEQAQANGNKE
jgi:hypothetical protein